MPPTADYNPTPHVIPEGDNATPLEVVGGDCTATEKLVIIMCGLPATGKTHIANRIARYIHFFLAMETEIFNVGEYRKRLYGAQLPAEFFDHSNAEYMAKREQACDAALSDLTEFMKKDGVRVGLLDSTNSTRKRRTHIREKLKSLKCKVIVLETIVDKQDLLEHNIRTIQMKDPQYKDIEEQAAYEDFQKKRDNYKSVYDTVDERDGSHIKIINNQTFIVHNARGYLPQKVVHFVMNLHTLPRVFYLSRHGQSEYNLLGKIGGDAGLTEAGLEYARRLADFAANEIGMETVKDEETGEEKRVPRPARLWTSTLRRTKETAQFIKREKITTHKWDNGDQVEWNQFQGRERRNIDELYAGVCDGLTYKEIEEKYPEEFARRQEDKLTYRYPRGESYMDVTLRLEPIVLDIERTREPILIVGHQGIHRLLYAYFMGLPRDQAPYVSIPLNTVIELTPNAVGCEEKRYLLLSKEEMMKDGQDEPVTSMPMKDKEAADEVRRKTAVSSKTYSFDPMNPPSF
jgi:broad specificity phosphatase PhoE/predicted kinase